MTLYGANGQINTTSVAGSSYTGLYAADGSYNIVTNTSSSYVGLHHACGAYNAFVVTNPSSNFYAANGSMNVIANSNSPSGFSPVQPIGVPSSNVLWTPLNDTGLVEWWDANSLSATPVSSWTGRKAGIIASQATGILQPTWSATARNSKPGLTFAGTQSLTFTPTGFPSGSTAGGISVAGFSSTASPVTNGQFAFTYGLSATTAGTARYIYQQANVDTHPGCTAGGTSGTGDNITDTFSWASTDRFVIFQISGTTGMVNTDGNTTLSGTLTTSTNTGVVTGAIGSWPVFGNNWVGVIQQAIVTNGLLSTSTRQKYEGWESWYDGKAGANLPSGHPYKLRAPFVSDP